MFEVGRKVEVSLEGKDSEAWFPATIHEDLGGGNFLAEYCRSAADDNPETVKIRVDSLHVRPCPPLLKDKTFALLEKVDAYFSFGWWTGIVTKVLEDSKFTVFFQQRKRAEEFHLAELRPHMEWKDGRWFTSSQDVTIPSLEAAMYEHQIPENGNANAAAAAGVAKSSRDGANFSEEKIPLVNLTKDLEHLTPDIGKLADMTASLMKKRQYSIDSSSVLSQSQKKFREGNTLTQQDERDASTAEMQSASLSPSLAHDKTNSAGQAGTGDHFSDNPSWGKRIQRRHRKGSAPRSLRKNMNLASNAVQKGTVQNLQDESVGAVVEGKDPGNHVEVAENEHAKKDVKLPVIICLPCAENVSSGFETSEGKRGRPSSVKGIIKLVNEGQLELNEIKDSKTLEGGGSSVKRKRGRPKKIALESLLTTAKANAQEGDGASDDVNAKDGDSNGVHGAVALGTDDSLPNQEMALPEDKEQSANDMAKLSNDQSPTNKKAREQSANDIAKSSNGQSDPTNGKAIVLKRRRRRKSSFKKVRRHAKSGAVADQVQESLDASGSMDVEEKCTVEAQKVVPEAPPCSGHDDEPLSKWIEGMHPPPVVGGSREALVSTVEQCIEERERRRDALVPEAENEKLPEIECKASASVDEVSIVPFEEVSLPFVKNTVLWKTIEAMEVFRKIPQRPHFQPLESTKESSREGLAIGFMVTFASVAEKASRLQLNDPQSVTDDLLETLTDLERHGFDTKVIHDRITELFAAKEKQRKLFDEVNELKGHISMHNRDKSKLDDEINEINEQIRQLRQKLSLAESTKEELDEMITFLQTRVHETEESIKNVARDFEVVGGFRF